MSAAQGITLKPVRLADLAATAVAAAAVKKSKYVPPSERAAEGPAPLTAAELSSTKLFPSLGLAAAVAAAAPLSFKKNVEDGIKKAQQELEEGFRREQITDPWEMTEEERRQNGWEMLSLRPNLERRRAFIDGLVDRTVQVTEDGPLILTPEIVADPVKLKFYTQISNMDGSPVEREKEPDYSQKESAISHDPQRLKEAAKKMWAFVGKK
jgi:hypothetical protein